MFADWVATFTIGVMFHAEISDILAFWAPFLLLHLGGPDNITSFSLEDNEFWIRHLLGLMCQIGSTVYVILQSLPDNKLWLPTLLVLIAGIIKYAERNRAIYLASFDHFNELDKRIIKNLLVGPTEHSEIRNNRREFIKERGSEEALRRLETEISLLYEALHTKLPVFNRKIGKVVRFISLGCIFGALLSFGLITKDYHQLGKSEIWLTYGLLIGAITLDFISIRFIIFSDYNLAFRMIPIELNWLAWITNGRRWSRRIPQLNFITDFVYSYYTPNWLATLNNFALIRIVLDTIKRIRCLSLGRFREDKVWRFIFEEVKKMAEAVEAGEPRIKIARNRGAGILDSNEEYRRLSCSVTSPHYTESLLIWHIATEVCFQIQEDEDYGPASPENMDCKERSKLISDYMFFLLMEPAVITMPNIDRQRAIAAVLKDLRTFSVDSISSLDGKKISKAIFSRERETDWLKPPVSGEMVTSFIFARILAFQLKELGFPWKIMSQVWVEMMCFVAINCRPNVHAQQPGKGGQLLTLVWSLMNSLGLGSLAETQESDSDHDIAVGNDIEDGNETTIPIDIEDGNESTIPIDDFGHGHEPTNPNELLFLLLTPRPSGRGRP